MLTGVPQGSELGPILFSIDVNYLANVTTKLQTIMYADDTAILVSGNPLELIQSEMTHKLKQIEGWFLDNKLALNLQKTKYTVFSSPSKDISAGVSDIKIRNKHIQRVESIKYLGVILDSCFNWKLHTEELCKKLGYSIYALVKTRQYFDSKALQLIYFSIFHTHFQYCVESWGFTYQSYKIGP